MLYIKEKVKKTKRDYSHLHVALTSEKLNKSKSKKKGRVTLSGKPKINN